MLKDVTVDGLARAIRSVASGDAVVSPRITRRLLDVYATQLPDLSADAPGPAPAEKLVVTEATVKTHVGSILAKLDLRIRVQAVIFAYDTGLVR